MPAIWMWFLVIVAVIFVGLELYAHFSGKIPTISGMIWKWQKVYPIIPFILGVIVGVLVIHFFGVNACPV